jgi:hypothetical protein
MFQMFEQMLYQKPVNLAVTTPKAIAGNLEPPRQAESVTAKAAEDIIASTPVA